MDFGLLDGLWMPYRFCAGEIAPLAASVELTAWIKRRRSRIDGRLYPVADDPQHQAWMWRAPATHRLTWNGATTNPQNRREIPKLFLDIVGFVYGNRLQFADWWHEAGIRAERDHWLILHHESIDRFLDTAYQFAIGLSPRNRRRLSAILYLLHRADKAHWTWERFLLLYTAIDTCWMIALDTGRIFGAAGPKRVRHAERIERLCQGLAIPNDPAESNQLVRLRNDLAHEAIWAADPCGDPDGPQVGQNDVSISADLKLRNLVRKAVLSLLDLPTTYRTLPWHIQGGGISRIQWPTA